MFFLSFVLGSLLYTVIFATGNVQHDYYQILILPTLAMLAGLGIDYLLTILKNKWKLETLGFITIGIIISLSVFFSWKIVKGYYYINRPSIVKAGLAVDRLTPKDSLIVALYNGDTSFLYQTNRQGWPTLQNGIDDLISKGADYLVFADPTAEEINFGKNYQVIEKTNDYIIFKLK